MSIQVGPLVMRNRVFLAPMAGITDVPFRASAWRNGAGLVMTEMVASEELLSGAENVRRRACNDGIHPFAVQLAGREARWMECGARAAAQLGADLIDINLGCPSRMVAGKLSGAALMRDPDRALALVEATLRGAGPVPVSIKMRLGWDSQSLTAPEIARRAEAAGVRMITIHARTRNQFYKGRADWRAVRQVRRAISIPLIINGDIVDEATARAALSQSGADGIMTGRGCQGRPWFAGELAERLDPGTGIRPLSLARQLRETRRLFEDMLAFHGEEAGLRQSRKHLGWAVERWRQAGLLDCQAAGAWRAQLVRENDVAIVRQNMDRLADTLLNMKAA